MKLLQLCCKLQMPLLMRLLLLVQVIFTRCQNSSLRVNTNLKEMDATAMALPSISTAGNICTREEPYVEVVQVPEVQPVRVRTSTWCLDIPPRCSSYKTEMREVMRVQVSVASVKLVQAMCLTGSRCLTAGSAFAG